MRALFDIVHPADVHFFKHAVHTLIDQGHHVLVASRQKDVTTALLDDLSIPHRVMSTQGKGLLGLFGELIRRDWGIAQAARAFEPDVLIGNNSPCAAHVGLLIRKPSIIFDDTEINRLSRFLYRSIVTEIHTPQGFRHAIGNTQTGHESIHALAYLHPDHFIHDPAIGKRYGLDTSDPVFLFRFVHWGAAHDVGVQGLSAAEKIECVRVAERYGRVIISSEGAAPPELRDRVLAIRPADLHQVLAGCAAFVGESATMVAEAVCLGLPALLIDQVGRGYTDYLFDDLGLGKRVAPHDWNAVLESIVMVCERANGQTSSVPHPRLRAQAVNMAAYQVRQILRLGMGESTAVDPK